MPDSPLFGSAVVMLLFIVVMGVLLLIVKKLAKNTKFNANTVPIKILSKLTIQPRVSLYVIQAGNKKVLIGVSDKSISALSDLDGTIETTSKESEALAQLQAQNPENKLNLNISENEDVSFGSFIKSLYKKPSK